MTEQENKIDFATVLASSVHDMKNSVSMLLSSLETILEQFRPEGEEQSKHFKTLHYEASRINGELVQLLTLYRMEGGFLPVHIDEYFVIDVFEDQIARNQILLETSDTKIHVDCDQDLYWYFDMDLIGGVFHDILVNCIRYTDSKLLVSAKEENGYLCIIIADDGPGYPEEMLANPANRVLDASISQGATHLGLFFAQKIASLHTQANDKGRIELRNGGPLGGGEFRLYLP